MSIWNLGYNQPNTQDEGNNSYMYDSNTGSYVYKPQDTAESMEEKKRRKQLAENTLAPAGYNSVWANTAGGVQKTYNQAGDYGVQENNITRDPSLSTGRGVRATAEQQDIRDKLNQIAGGSKDAILSNLDSIRSRLGTIESSNAGWVLSNPVGGTNPNLQNNDPNVVTIDEVTNPNFIQGGGYKPEQSNQTDLERFNKLLENLKTGGAGGEGLTSMSNRLNQEASDYVTNYLDYLSKPINTELQSAGGELSNIESQYNNTGKYNLNDIASSINNPYTSAAERYGLITLRNNLMGTGLYSANKEAGSAIDAVKEAYDTLGGDLSSKIGTEKGEAAGQYSTQIKDYLDSMYGDAGLSNSILNQLNTNPTEYDPSLVFGSYDVSKLPTSESTNKYMTDSNRIMEAINNSDNKYSKELYDLMHELRNQHASPTEFAQQAAYVNDAKKYSEELMKQYNSARLRDYLNAIGNKYGKVAW